MNKYDTAGIKFGYERTLRKWSFSNGQFTFATSVKGGQDGAKRIAAQIKGALARTGGAGLDQLARTHIKKYENYV